MQFDHIDNSNKYASDVLNIIRQGIVKDNALQRRSREDIKTQRLVEEFNILGTSGTVSDIWIGAQKEYEHTMDNNREDIYFHLNDDNHTPIFFVEAKRLPKPNTQDQEEYVVGIHVSGNPCGGIQRYKLLKHGVINIQYNGMIGYVENKTVDEWLKIVNEKISQEYPQDTPLTVISGQQKNEYSSHHNYINSQGSFTMHHFWLDLTGQN